MFSKNSKMGYATDSLGPEDFVSLLERLIVDADLRHTIANYNRHYAWDNLAASHVAGRLRQIYSEMLTVW